MYISQNMKIGPQNRLFNHNFQPGLNTPPRPTSPGPITGPTRLPCPPFPVPHPTPTAGGRSHERTSQTRAPLPACTPIPLTLAVARGGRAPAAARSGQQPSKQRTSAERWRPAARSRARGQAALAARAGLGASLGTERPGSDLPFFPQRF